VLTRLSFVGFAMPTFFFGLLLQAFWGLWWQERGPDVPRIRTRCPVAQELCAIEVPPPAEVAQRHAVACHFPIAPGETLLDRVRALGRRADLLGP
jgi:hypothetical protein